MHGWVRCPPDLQPLSSCVFSCDHGYYLEGYTSTVCRLMGDRYDWDKETPKCVKGRLTLTISLYQVGNKCNVTCGVVVLLWTWLSIATCTDYEHMLSRAGWPWSNPTPVGPKDNVARILRWYRHLSHDIITTYILLPVKCAFLPRRPRYGSKKCSGDAPNVGSVCGFECDNGYTLKGYRKTTCRRDRNEKTKGTWDRDVPTCERTTFLLFIIWRYDERWNKYPQVSTLT